MISIKQSEKVVRSYLHSIMTHVPAGILTTTGNIPSYKCRRYGVPPICQNSRKHKETRAYCEKYYASLKSDEQRSVCPFGINISYLKTDKAANPIDFFLQTGFTETSISNDIEKNLSRKPKKAIRNSKIEMPKYKFYADPDNNVLLDLLNRISETLFAGRVAASMRALTHQFLTPVQAVMSDLQLIEYNHKRESYTDDDKIIQLMHGNVEEINNIAKQIHILLSEDLTPSPERIRKITVHRMIKSICKRLESIAEKKNLLFQVDFNNGFKVIDAVPNQIDIVFRCLLENAAKYSFNGKSNDKRTINIRFKDTRLDDVKALQVSIQNYGCLISQEEIEQRRIFELGYRGDFSGDKGRQGTGSGLYLVDRIVEAHYGEIYLESKADGNPDDHQAINTFIITWPIFFS